MKALAFIIGLSACMLNSCADNLNETLADDECLFLTGHTCEAMHTAIPSASYSPSFSPAGLVSSLPAHTTSSTALTEGSRIWIHATGSLVLPKEVLTYRNKRWESELPLPWNPNADSAWITALYPAYPDGCYDASQLYDGHTLTDVLYVHESFPAGSPIHLRFKHLFAQLRFQLSPTLQKNCQKLEITCPYMVSHIDPQTTQLTLSNDHPQVLTWLPTSSDDLAVSSSATTYATLIPPCNHATFQIQVITSTRTLRGSFSIPQVESGQIYQYTIKDSENMPGIATIDDWIAFSKLMNDPNLKKYHGKTLDDFRKKEHGVTTYYLLNDLDFEGIDPKQTKAIPSDRSLAPFFPYTFDGQGHTLSNLTLQARFGGCGLFTGIDKTGCLKNLHLRNCSITINNHNESNRQGIGILAGANLGTIHDCSIDNCEILVKSTVDKHKAYTGGLTGKSEGKIYNCSARRINIQYKVSNDKEHATGGLVGLLKGTLHNSYAAQITLNNSNNYTGGICGMSEKAQVENCYVYQIKPNKNLGLVAGYTSQSSFQSIFWEKGPIPAFKKSLKSIQNDCFEYNDTNNNTQSPTIYDQLNSWILHTGSKQYPDESFTLWGNSEEALPAILLH